MRNGSAAVLFTTMMAVIVAGGFIMFYRQFLPPEKTAVSCLHKDVEYSTTISLLIDKKTGEVMMSGEAINPEHIKINNETAVSAAWSHKAGRTKMFLDRIAGKLEIEISQDGVHWDKTEFQCSTSRLKF